MNNIAQFEQYEKKGIPRRRPNPEQHKNNGHFRSAIYQQNVARST